MKKPPTDVGASVHARLLRLAREQGEDYQLLLSRYANERLLFRLSASGMRSSSCSKAPRSSHSGPASHTERPAISISLASETRGVAHVREVFSKVLKHNVVDDGVHFDLATLAVDLIREEGVRWRARRGRRARGERTGATPGRRRLREYGHARGYARRNPASP
jgi:hypothetical protein